MPLSKNAVYLLESRYCKNGESPENVFKRTAEFLAKGDSKFEENLYTAMITGLFLPNSPALFSAGFPKPNLHACYVLPIEDDLTSIFKTVTNMARIFKGGGGVGINFSKLREKDAPLSGGGTSSGAISFMGIFDNVVDIVKQGGVRRGALMGILNENHPEIFNFIRVKLEKKLQNFNLSIMVTDDFMSKVETDGSIEITSPNGMKYGTVKAKDIFELIAFASWCNGDPALLFFDRINKDNPLYPETVIDTCNPCFTGDTKIDSPLGKIPIAELVGKELPVYCYDGEKINISIMKNIRKTGIKKEVWKVVLDNDEEIKVTPNHKFMLRDGTYKEVKDLCIGQSLMPLHRHKRNSKGYYNIMLNNGKSIGEAHLVAEWKYGRKIVKGEVPHHVNGIKTDNSPQNIILLMSSLHNSEHIKGKNNPLIKLKESGEFENFYKRNKGYNQKGENNTMFGKKHSEESKKKNREAHLGRIPWNKGLTKETMNLNHKIKRIEFCGYEDVYDGEVETYHNFALAAGVIVHNCSEVALPAYSACCLGSLNVSKFVWKNEFNFDRFADACKLGMRTLTNMNELSHYPMREIKETMMKYNPVGLGLMGFADALIKLGIYYDSQECLDFIDKLGAVYKKATFDYEPDKFYFYRRIIAPTGSLSILADCFTEDTKVSLLSGEEEEIKNLVNKDFFVYSYDIENRKIVPGKATAKKFNRSKILKITLDNGEEIKCTPNHKFLLRNSLYKEAKDLTVGESLMPLYRRYLDLNRKENPKGYEQILQPSEFRDYWVFTHRRMVNGKSFKNGVVHHIDFNKRNNDPTNLLWMYKDEHIRLHSKLTCPFKINNPSKKPEIKAIRSKLMSQNNPMWKKEARDKVALKNRGKKRSEESVKKMKETMNLIGNPFLNKKHSEEAIQKMSEYRKEWMKNNINPNTRLDITSEIVYYLRDTKQLTWGEIAKELNCDISTVRNRYVDESPKNVCGSRNPNHKTKKKQLMNHKIVSIEYLEEEQDTYCLVVDNYHNFALSAGVFVHNCSSGIEPIYDLAFERSLTIGKIEETRDLYKSKYVRTAHQVSPEWHVKVTAKFQKWIEGGISKTVNMPNNASVDDVKNIYKQAWKSGCKGITIYRDGSRDQVLTSLTNKFTISGGKCSDGECTL